MCTGLINIVKLQIFENWLEATQPKEQDDVAPDSNITKQKFPSIHIKTPP